MKPSNSYITEETVIQCVSKLFGKSFILNRFDAKDKLGFSPDICLIRRNLKLVIEFDGVHHFTNNSVVERDIRQRKLASSNGFSLVRIPYFVQLDEAAIHAYLNIRVNKPFNLFPHGFIEKKVILPGRFSTLGYMKFKGCLGFLRRNNAENIVEAVMKSLLKRVEMGGSFFACFGEVRIEKLPGLFKWCSRNTSKSITKRIADEISLIFPGTNVYEWIAK